MKTEAVVLVVAILVVGSFGLGYFVSITNRQGTTTVSTETTSTPSTVQSASSSVAGGLVLSARVNTTTLQVGQSLRITVSLHNDLPKTMNLTPFFPMNSSFSNGSLGDWVVNGFPVNMWGGCFAPLPVEFVIVKGNFSVAELQVASANTSVWQSTSQFWCVEGGWVSNLAFQPMSSVANLTGVECTWRCFPDNHIGVMPLNSSFTVNGYWAYPFNSSEAKDILRTPPQGCTDNEKCFAFNYPEVGPTAQHLFTSGWYTMVVADEWGQTVIIRFQVT